MHWENLNEAAEGLEGGSGAQLPPAGPCARRVEPNAPEPARIKPAGGTGSPPGGAAFPAHRAPRRTNLPAF